MASEQYQLDRLATAFKKAGDWDGAIAALRKRKALLGVRYDDTKLAKYCQEAGRFDDAMAEIQWLLDSSYALAKASFGHQPKSVMERQRLSWCARIHGAAVLICKRAQRTDLQAVHQQERALMARLSCELGPQAKADIKAKHDAWEEARQAGPKAMVAFFEGKKIT